mmetsp:Transcript_33061/g.68861  ORF Transcript_33061/g.68861 Transcript_33061/m.68861 type:complete len:112 (+) Transcript_33061:1637-1972(+)
MLEFHFVGIVLWNGSTYGWNADLILLFFTSRRPHNRAQSAVDAHPAAAGTKGMQSKQRQSHSSLAVLIFPERVSRHCRTATVLGVAGETFHSMKRTVLDFVLMSDQPLTYD